MPSIAAHNSGRGRVYRSALLEHCTTHTAPVSVYGMSVIITCGRSATPRHSAPVGSRLDSAKLLILLDIILHLCSLRHPTRVKPIIRNDNRCTFVIHDVRARIVTTRSQFSDENSSRYRVPDSELLRNNPVKFQIGSTTWLYLMGSKPCDLGTFERRGGKTLVNELV
ncbi:hypothetical protein J6590_030893 [Homalodisca vitripennis]|nr:hypothetical protein J6590_030893 [Homalodisca vitripennis]